MLVHDIGQLAGHALNALPGYSTLGSNITNPNINYKGAYNPPTPSNNYYTPPQPSGGQVPGASTTQPQAQQTSGAYDAPGSAQAIQDAQDRANVLFGIDSGLGSANDALGRLQSQLDTGNGNLDREAQSAYGQLDAGNTIATRDYNTGRTGQVNEYVGKQSQNNQNARTFLDAGRRTLGVNGAGGGSAARYALPFEAQQQATQANSADQAVNNKNLIALDTNYQDTQDKYRTAREDVGRQRDQGGRDLQSKIANQRATLLDTIAQLTGQKSIANGGDFHAAQNAAAQYTSKIPALLDQINALSATPAITTQQVSANPVNLAGYNYARPAATPTPQQDPTLAGPGYVPTYGQDGQDQQQNPVYSLFGLDPNQRQFA